MALSCAKTSSDTYSIISRSRPNCQGDCPSDKDMWEGRFKGFCSIARDSFVGKIHMAANSFFFSFNSGENFFVRHFSVNDFLWKIMIWVLKHQFFGGWTGQMKGRLLLPLG